MPLPPESRPKPKPKPAPYQGPSINVLEGAGLIQPYGSQKTTKSAQPAQPWSTPTGNMPYPGVVSPPAQQPATQQPTPTPWSTPTGNQPYPGVVPPQPNPLIQSHPAPIFTPQGPNFTPQGYPAQQPGAPIQGQPAGFQGQSINAREGAGAIQPYSAGAGYAAPGQGGSGGGGGQQAQMVSSTGPSYEAAMGETGGGGGGGGGGGTQATPGAAPVVPPVVPPGGQTDLTGILKDALRAQPGGQYKIPPAIQSWLSSSGLYERFLSLLQSLGLSNIGGMGVYGFGTDFQIPPELANIDLTAMMQSMTPDDRTNLGLLLGSLLGVSGNPAQPTPGTPIPPTPSIPPAA